MSLTTETNLDIILTPVDPTEYNLLAANGSDGYVMCSKILTSAIARNLNFSPTVFWIALSLLGLLTSDINKFGRAAARGTSFRDFAKTLKKGREQGTYNHYVSIDTQVLAMILESVTDMPLREYLSKKLWNGSRSVLSYVSGQEKVIRI